MISRFKRWRMRKRWEHNLAMAKAQMELAAVYIQQHGQLGSAKLRERFLALPPSQQRKMRDDVEEVEILIDKIVAEFKSQHPGIELLGAVDLQEDS